MIGRRVALLSGPAVYFPYRVYSDASTFLFLAATSWTSDERVSNDKRRGTGFSKSSHTGVAVFKRMHASPAWKKLQDYSNV